MNVIIITLLILVVCSNAYHVLAAFCGMRFRFQTKPDLSGSSWPHSVCLKPLCGHDHETAHNLRSFLDQDYPCYQVIFGTAREDDPAHADAVSVSRESGTASAQVTVGERGTGVNRKIRNVRNIEAQAAQDAEIFVLSDSDVRVTRDYLKHMIAPLRRDPAVGAVTALYRLEHVSCLGALIEALAVEATFAPGVLVATTFSSLRYAFGASIALKRADFLQAGGFAAVEDFLADDYQIGHLLHQAGKRVVLSPYVIPIVVPEQSLSETFAHLLRWNRTIRVCQPAGYFFSIICHPVLWALLAFAALGATPVGWLVLAGTALVRVVTAAVVAVALGAWHGMLRSLLTPVWDLASAVLWTAGLAGNEVLWRGVRYRLCAGGRMQEASHG